MPISTFVGIQTSLRGLLAQQRALDVTSHNIANANTAGYSRQEATLVTSDALHISGLNGGMLGTGVDVQSYKRVRDQFLDLQYRGQSTSLGEQTARSDALTRVELSLSEPGENGIAARLSEFWGAWANLSNGATNPAARQAVIDKTRTLAATIDDLQGSLVAARDADHLRDARRAHQPDRTGGSLMSTRTTNNMISRSVLTDLNDIAAKQAATRRQMSSGKAITRPSDDPYLAGRAMSLRGELDRVKQHADNVQEAQGWMTVPDTALGQIGDMANLARGLVVQGGTDTLPQASRDALAAQIDQIIAGMKQEPNATYDGRYVLGGNKTANRPYDSSLTGTDDYNGDY